MRDFKKWLQRLAQMAYYQAGKIVVQTLLPLHPPVALITLDLSGSTRATPADTYIPMDDTFNTHWCSFLESRLIGLYGGKAASSLFNHQYLVNGKNLKFNVKHNDVPVKKGNGFQSNIGTQEIHTATRLAAAMVNNWDFYSPQSLELLNKTAIFHPLQLKSKNLKEKSIGFTKKFPHLVIFAYKTDGISATSLFNPRLAKQRSRPANNFVSKNSEELNYSLVQLQNNRPLRSLKYLMAGLTNKKTLAVDKALDFLIPPASYTGFAIDCTAESNEEKRVHLLFSLHAKQIQPPKFTSWVHKLPEGSRNLFNSKFSYNDRRAASNPFGVNAVENVGIRTSPRMDAFQLVNPLQFSIAQRDRFYPGWFRLYLPDIEATEFLTNIANYYFSSGLQTLTRPSLNEFASMFLDLDICDIQSTSLSLSKPMYHTTFFPFIDFCENSIESGHTGNSLRTFELFNKSDNVIQNENYDDQLMFCGIFGFTPYPQRGFEGSEAFSFQGKKAGFLESSLSSVNLPSEVQPSSSVQIDNFPMHVKSMHEEQGNIQSKKNCNLVNERLLETTSWNLRQLKESNKLKTSGTKHQIDTSFISNVIPCSLKPLILTKEKKGENNVISDSPIARKDFFFCCGGNSLSIGVGLLRSAAKRRSQLHVKNQDFLKSKQAYYPSGVPTISYPSVSTALWGYSKPWNINRLINIGSRQEFIQQNTLQCNNSQKEKNKRLSYLNTNVLLNRMEKKKNILRSKTIGWDKKTFRYSGSLFDSTANIEGVNPKVIVKQGQRIISEKSNENFHYYDQINNTKRKKSPAHLNLPLSFSLEKQNFPIGYNDAPIIEKEWVYHSLVNNCFSKAFFLIDQNRQLTDYFADYLARFQILRQHQILYLFSTVLLNCKKQVQPLR